jgi:hypothetical protein
MEPAHFIVQLIDGDDIKEDLFVPRREVDLKAFEEMIKNEFNLKKPFKLKYHHPGVEREFDVTRPAILFILQKQYPQKEVILKILIQSSNPSAIPPEISNIDVKSYFNPLKRSLEDQLSKPFQMPEKESDKPKTPSIFDPAINLQVISQVRFNSEMSQN